MLEGDLELVVGTSVEVGSNNALESELTFTKTLLTPRQCYRQRQRGH